MSRGGRGSNSRDDFSGFGGGGVPEFDKNGTALTHQKRVEIAQKKGICVKCGIKTHDKKMLKKIALTNDHVYGGVCIRCNPDNVPEPIFKDWQKKYQPRQDPRPRRPKPHSHSERPGQSITASSRVDGGRYPGTITRPRPGDSGARPLSPPRTATVGDFNHLLRPGAGSSGGNISNGNTISGNLPSSRAPWGMDNGSSGGGSSGGISDPNSSRISSQNTGSNNGHGSSQALPHTAHSHKQPLQVNVVVNEDYRGGNSTEDAWQIAKALRENRANPDVLKLKLHRLRNLGDNESGALYEIKEIMDQYRNDPRVMAAACGALWGVTAQSDDKKCEATDSGALVDIVDALRNVSSQRDPDFVQWALGTLCCLTKGVDNKKAIAHAGGIEATLDCMKKHVNSPGVFEWAVRLLHSLAHQCGDEADPESMESAEVAIRHNIETIADSDGIPVIVAAMSAHPSENLAQQWAAKLLWRLQDRDSQAMSIRIIQKMIENGVVGVCTKVIKARATSSITFELVASLMYNCLAVTGIAGSPDEMAECLQATVRKMNDNPDEERLQESALLLLSIIVGASRLQFKETKGIRSVLNAMSRFSSNLQIQRNAIQVLWAVSYVPAFFDQTYLSDSILAIESSHRYNPDDVPLLTASCGFIGNTVVGHSGIEGIPFKIPLFALSMEANVRDKALVDQAGRALGCICVQYPQLVQRIIETNGIECLLSSLKSESSHALSAEFAALIVIARTSDDCKRKLVAAGCLEVIKNLLQSGAGLSPLGERMLELLSTVVCTEKRSPMSLPPDIFQVLLRHMRSIMTDYAALERCCGVMRNLLVVSTPGSRTVDFDGIVDFMTDLINSRPNPVDLKREACGVLWALTSRQTKQSSTNLSNMFRSIMGVMGLYKGEELAFNSELQSVAAGALATVCNCIRDNIIHIASEDVEEIIGVMYMTMEYDLKRTELLEKFLDIILSLSFIDEGVVIQCGGIVVVIDAMVEHEPIEAIQERGCSILSLLSSTENLQVNLCIAETDGIDMIVSALAVFPQNERIQVDACKALSHLSVDQESRMLIASQGGLLLIVNSMNSNEENVDLLEGGCSALLNLSSDAEEQLLVESGVVGTVVQMMKYHPDAPRLQEKALGVLQNVSMRNATAKQSIAKAGGISAVTMSIKEFMGSPTVLERAFTTMWSLAVLDRNQIEIGNSGGIGLVVNGMMANIEYEKVQKQACGCLCTLSSNSRNKTLIRDAGGVDAIVYAMWAHYDSESVQIEACRALSSLAVNVQTNEVMIATDGEINAIISAMRRFPDSAKLQEHVCVALRNFMLSADNAGLIRSNAQELRGLMARAAQRFPDRCSERASQVLASLS